MEWVKVTDEHPCRQCGIAIQHWVLLNPKGLRVVEANFCPVCYPDIKKVFEAEWARAAA